LGRLLSPVSHCRRREKRALQNELIHFAAAPFNRGRDKKNKHNATVGSAGPLSLQAVVPAACCRTSTHSSTSVRPLL
jgi:hypothetical protein